MVIKNIRRLAVLTVMLLAMFSIAACATSDNTSDTSAQTSAGTTESTTAQSEVSTIDISDISNQYDEEDTDSSWDESTATMIQLNGTSIEVTGSGASADGSILTISAAGTYVLNGTLDDGQILITASDSDTVRLVLNGVDITCKTGAPIYAQTADKLVVILEAGTENTVTDGGENFAYANTTDEEPDAAVFSKCDLTINGTGTLTVNAGFNNGIGTKDDLVIVSGNFKIDAVNHGIRGRDSITVLDGEFTITAGNDGIQSNNEDTSKGWIYLEGGNYHITSGCDGIQAETLLAITGGDYTIESGGGSANASSVDTTNSYKGLKSGTDLSIVGGTFNIDSADDCVHSNGNISISDGELTLASGDDGAHADADLSVSGGSIIITTSYEGLEGATVNLSGGSIDIVSSDDAINAAGGSDSGEGGMFGKDSFSEGSSSYYINISGGDIVYYAGGDGLDSNGDITISGGTLIGIINSTADNEAIDLDGTLSVTGGTLIYGGTGVGGTPSENSTQSYVYLSSGISANTKMSVQKDGETLVDFTLAHDCQYLAISTPDIVSDESYDIYSGDSLLTTITAGTGAPEGMGGGQGGGGQGGGDRGGQRSTPPQ